MERKGKPVPAPRWLSENGPDNDVVLSTRCRLARNLVGVPFPWRAGEGDRRQAAKAIRDAVERAGRPLSQSFSLRGDALDRETADVLLQWRYVSLDWLRGGSHRQIFILPDTRVALMTLEEDHLRLQAILPGLLVESTVEHVQAVEAALSQHLEFAQNAETGYFTSSLTNAGSGMRVSALLHLPGLAALGSRDEALEAASELGCAIRGLYGEGTQGTGELFQVSYRYTYGVSTAQALSRVEAAARYLVETERAARCELFCESAGRNGLKTAAKEALDTFFQEEATPRRLLPLLSILRLAAAEGVLTEPLNEFAGLFAMAGLAEPAQLSQGESDTASERYEAIRRTSALRQRLRSLRDRNFLM